MRGYNYQNIGRLFNEWLFYLFFKNKKKVIQKLNNSLKKDIEESIDFTLRNVGYYIQFLPEGKPDFLKDKTLLEIGPGQDLGIVLALAGFGLKNIVIIDPFFIDWNPDFHPEFYNQLLLRLKNIYPAADFQLIQNILEKQSHLDEQLQIYQVSLENASCVPNELIDISISNATFEHFVLAEQAVKELSRITKPGGLGFHQIDMRDHEHFDRPLEFLTCPNPIYRYITKISNALRGNRLRYTEYNQLFEQYGFEVTFKVDAYADEDYLNDILTRCIDDYRVMPREVVAALGGRFFIEKGTI